MGEFLKGFEKNDKEIVDFYEYVFQNLIASVRYIVDGKLVWNNEYDQRIFGYESGDIVSEKDEILCLNQIHPDDIKQIENSKKKIIESGEKSYVLNVRIKNIEGEWLNTIISYTDVSHKKNDGKKHCLLMIADATEQLANFTKIESIAYENARLKYKLILVYLSKREKEILSLLTQGLSTKEIAEKLSVSFYTVETHRRNILRKSGMKNINQLVRFATECGIK